MTDDHDDVEFFCSLAYQWNSFNFDTWLFNGIFCRLIFFLSSKYWIFFLICAMTCFDNHWVILQNSIRTIFIVWHLNNNEVKIVRKYFMTEILSDKAPLIVLYFYGNTQKKLFHLSKVLNKTIFWLSKHWNVVEKFTLELFKQFLIKIDKNVI